MQDIEDWWPHPYNSCWFLKPTKGHPKWLDLGILARHASLADERVQVISINVINILNSFHDVVLVVIYSASSWLPFLVLLPILLAARLAFILAYTVSFPDERCAVYIGNICLRIGYKLDAYNSSRIRKITHLSHQRRRSLTSSCSSVSSNKSRIEL